MTTTDTRAAIHAAIRDLFLGSSTPAVARVTIDAAITAHVEAEVARRLAAAPGVETALAAYGAAVYELGYVLHRPDRDAVLRPVKDTAEATLRAAIAADRERAVLGARLSRVAALRLVDAHGDSIRRTERAASRIGTTNAGEHVTEQMVTEQINARAAVIDALTGGEDAPPRITSTTGVVPVVADAEGRMLGGRQEGRDTIYDQVKVPVATPAPLGVVVDAVLWAVGQCHDGSDLWSHMRRDPDTFRREVARVLSGKLRNSPTPDEARRLVGEFAGAHGAMVAHLAGMTGPESGEDVAARTESARTALLRALGVES